MNTDGMVRPSAKAATGDVLVALMAIDQLRRDGHNHTADAIIELWRPEIERLKYEQLNDTGKMPN